MGVFNSLIKKFLSLNFIFLFFISFNLNSQTPNTVIKVELLKTLSAKKMAKGLGVNISTDLRFLSLAKEMGVTEVRVQPAWISVEKIDKSLSLPQNFSFFLDECKKLNLNPLLVAAYGPPYIRVGTAVVIQDVDEGSFDIPLLLDPSKNIRIQPPYDLVQMSSGKQLVAEGTWVYGGTLIKNYKSNVLSLYNPTSVEISKGTVLNIYRYLYNPPTSDDYTKDSSIKAYGRYVQFLETEISKRGLTGNVEIWNEPKWAHDFWDSLGCFIPGGKCFSPNFGFAKMLLNMRPRGNVRYQWGGTHKSGFNSIMSGSRGRIGLNVTKDQVLGSMAYESFHPYGPTPEYHAWDPNCILTSSNPFSCSLEGTLAGSNDKWAAGINEKNKNEKRFGINLNISETGLMTSDEKIKTRYWLRSFLTYMGLGFSNINFYNFSGKMGPDMPSYSIVDGETLNPTQTFYSFKSLMAKFRSIAVDSLGKSEIVPSVKSYIGSWPLTVVPVLGRKNANEKVDTIEMFLWQRTYPLSVDASKTVGDTFDTIWQTMPSPAPGMVNLKIIDKRVVKAWKVSDWTEVPVKKINDFEYQVRVQEDPVMVEFNPL